MTKKLSAMFLLSLLIMVFLASSVVWSADKPVKRFKERASSLARFAPLYGAAGADSPIYPTAPNKGGNQIALGMGPTPDASKIVGNTAYDYQHNCTMGWQIRHGLTDIVHMDWMDQDNDELGVDRGVGYTAFDLSTCGSGPNGYNPLFNPYENRIEPSYSGYVNLDVMYGGGAVAGCALPTAHSSPETEWFANVGFDLLGLCPLAAMEWDAPVDKYGHWQNNGVGPGNENIWPIIAHQEGTDLVIHMVTCESGGAAGDPQTLSYYRRVGPYEKQDSAHFVWSEQKLIDTVMNINPTIVASKTTDKVALVWNAPMDDYRDGPEEFESQYSNDIWFAISTNQGADWLGSGTPGPSIGSIVDLGVGMGYDADGGRVTAYDSLGERKAYCDIAALLDASDNLHIVWGGRFWTGDTLLFRRSSFMDHWDQTSGTISTVYEARWDSGGSCFEHAWGSDLAKMSLSQCDGKLYVLYTQFGTPQVPCDDNDATDNVVTGKLYVTVSANGGLNWDRPQKVTDTDPTPNGCTQPTGFNTADGTCNSEYWASMTPVGRLAGCGDNVGQNVLDVLYINDYAPGGVVQPESGVWTLNPVMWTEYVCRDIVVEPLYADDGGPGWGVPYEGEFLWAMPSPGPGNTATRTLNMWNPGLADNAYTLSVDYTDGTGWISPATGGGTILWGGADTSTIVFTFTSPSGAPDPSAWEADIRILHSTLQDSLRIIPVVFVVTDTLFAPESVVLATSCKQVRVYNHGQLVNDNAGEAMDFFDDCDTFNSNTTSDVYLYDGSPVITYDDAGTRKIWTQYSREWYDDEGLRPLGKMITDDTDPNYTKASGVFATADTSIGFKVEYYVPKAGNCDFMVEKLSWYPLKGAMSGVLVGEFLDWDVPADSGSDNGSGFDATRNLIYQFGGEYDQDDSTEALCPQESSDRYAGIGIYGGVEAPLKNMMTLDNATYVYSSGPFGNDAPLPADTTYGLMDGVDSYSIWSSSDPDSQYTDISTLVTFGKYDLVAQTESVIKVLATSKTGLADLQAAIDAGYTFIDDYLATCDCVPGDANADGGVNVGDAVYVIGYVFSGGSAPTPYPICSGDANGDCGTNVGDAVYVIGYVFSGGEPPVDCDTWAGACGALQK